MALGSQLPIRLDAETDRRLQSAAENLGTSKSALIRLLAKTFCDQVIQEDGSIAMPLNWDKLLPKSDNRSAKGRRPKEASAEAAVDDVIAAHVAKVKGVRPKKPAR